MIQNSSYNSCSLMATENYEQHASISAQGIIADSRSSRTHIKENIMHGNASPRFRNPTTLVYHLPIVYPPPRHHPYSVTHLPNTYPASTHPQISYAHSACLLGPTALRLSRFFTPDEVFLDKELEVLAVVFSTELC